MENLTMQFMMHAIPMLIIITLNLAVMEASSSVLDLSGYASTAKNVSISESLNSSIPILISGDGAYSWQFYPYHYGTKDQYLLVVLNTLSNTTTVVWIANRNRSVSLDAALLFALPSRQFILRDRTGTEPSSSSSSSGSVVWSSPAGIYSVEMNATGNLLMLDAHNSTLWQSFDYPSDVMVAGQSLKAHQSLVSSVSSENVSEGMYVLRVEPGGVVFYADLDEQQKNVPYELFTYSFTYALGRYSGTDASGSSGGSLAEALHSSCNRTLIVYDPDGIELSLQQEGYTITPECEAETGGFTVHGVTFTTRSGGISGFRYLKLMPNGDVQTFLVSDSDGVVTPMNEPTQGFFSTFCKLPSYCGINSLCSSYQTCSCPDLFQPINASDPSEGCRLQSGALVCSSSVQRHQFLEIPGADYFANSYTSPLMYNITAEECKDLCLPNCSCTAAFHSNDTGDCYLYNQVHTMQSDTNPSMTAFLKVPNLSSESAEFSIYLKRIVIGVSVAACFVLLGFGILGLWIGKKLKLGDPEPEPDSEEEAFLESLPGLPPRYSYKELHLATQGFSKKLGSGGSGSVYEGRVTLYTSDNHRKQILVEAGEAGEDEEDINNVMGTVAVKELQVTTLGRTSISATGKKQFRAEVATLGSLSHVNLVQLRGFCAEGVHRLLVYEYLENGSLDKWIFCDTHKVKDPIKEDGAYNANEMSYGIREIDKWDVRYRIAVDMARGLAFLHEGCRDKVLHLDVKPQNILLDGMFRAKLSDFGVSKLIERETRGDHTQTQTAMRGTPGYMAPEWFLNLPVTDKSDVFSYGMVLLELVGGRKNAHLHVDELHDGIVDMHKSGHPDEGIGWYFPAWAAKQAGLGKTLDIVDKRLLTNVNQKAEEDATSSLIRLIHVAFWCIQEDPIYRPSMSTVLLMLEEHVQVPDPPLHLHYIPRQVVRPSSLVFPSSTSIASLTMSSIESIHATKFLHSR